MIDPLLGLSFNLHAHKGTYALLLGSGISRSAGIPTGWEITLELIAQLAHLQRVDCRADPAGWYSRTFRKDPDYAELLAAVAPTSAAQQQLLKHVFEPTEQERDEGKKLPTVAHKAIARLVRLGHIRVIVTTNFDRLLEAALLAEGVSAVVIASTDAAKGAPPFVHSSCTLLKVHGDYLDHRIKNAPEALAKYDKAMDRLLDQVLDEYGLIVSGWSAEYDTALRSAIERCKSRRYPMYWTALSAPSAFARSMIDLRGAHVIAITGADSFFGTLLENITALDEFDRPHPLSAQAAVVATKRYLSEDKYRIALRDLLLTEADATRASVDAAFARVDHAKPGRQSAFELMRRIEAACEKLAHIFAHTSFHSNVGQAKPMFDAFVRVGAHPPSNGGSIFHLYRYAALQLVYAVGIAAIAAENYAGLQLLASRPSIFRADLEGNVPAPIRVHAHNVLDRDQARSVIPGMEKHRTPLSDHLLEVMRQPLACFVASDAEYERLFDSFEYLWCLLHVDADFQKPAATLTPWTPYGSFIWRRHERSGDWFEHEVAKVIADQDEQWPPLVQGLFGGDIARLHKAYGHAQPKLAKMIHSL